MSKLLKQVIPDDRQLAEETLINFLDPEGFDIPEAAIDKIVDAMISFHNRKLEK